jgi:hypothetical protein
VLLHDLAVLDLAAPGAGLLLLHLDERLEARQVGADRALDVTHPAGRLLEQRAGLDVEVELDPRQPRRELVEAHDAGVRDALGHAPLDALVRTLGLDPGRELLRLAPDLGRELDRRLVVLRHAGHAMHELRPVLVLGPLVVGRLERHGHVDRLLDRHAPALADTRHAAVAAAVAVVVAAAADARQQAARGLLGDAAGAAGFIDLPGHGVLDVRADLLAGLRGDLRRSARRTGDAAAAQGFEALLRQRRRGRQARARGEALHPRERALLGRRRSVADVLDSFAHHVTERVTNGVAHVVGHGFSHLLVTLACMLATRGVRQETVGTHTCDGRCPAPRGARNRAFHSHRRHTRFVLEARIGVHVVSVLTTVHAAAMSISPPAARRPG